MVTEFQDLLVMHCVVKHASYAKAAEELGSSPSRVSRVISRLEEGLGVRLVQRTTRKLSLTEAGHCFYEQTASILADLSDAELEVQRKVDSPRGRLRISVPTVFGKLILAPLLAEFSRNFPELKLELRLADKFIDLSDEGVDLAIRIGPVQESGLVARRLCTNRRLLVASPAYLERAGRPSRATDLKNHQCVVFSGFKQPNQWRLTCVHPLAGYDCGGATDCQKCSKKSEAAAASPVEPRTPSGFSGGTLGTVRSVITADVQGRVVTNSVDVLTTAALQGLGIAPGATMSVGPHLLSGELVRVLPDLEFEPSPIHAVYPATRKLSSKVQAAVSYLEQQLSDPPSWDRALIGRIEGFQELKHADGT